MNRILCLILLFVFLFSPGLVFAHMVGQPPFFKVDGVYTGYYPVPTTSLNDFDLPQDVANPVLINEDIEFEIDRNQLPVLPDVIDQTQFLWEFGDGESAEGLKNSHSYKKIGSYTLEIKAQYQKDQPQLIQSTRINVVQNKTDKLPQVKIFVNEKESKDPLTDVINVDYSKEVHFRGESDAKIISYRWDFGDGKSSTEKNPTHIYDKDMPQLFPVLRVVDENGFIADAYVEIDNKPESLVSSSTLVNNVTAGGLNLVWIVGLVLVLIIAGVFVMKRKK